jgi:GGDEF domain-containing protein
VIDVDRLGRYNDAFGDAAGDRELRQIAELGRQKIEAMKPGDREQRIRLTISIGAAGHNGHSSDPGDWQLMLRRADAPVRRVKTLGGNRVEAADG